MKALRGLTRDADVLRGKSVPDVAVAQNAAASSGLPAYRIFNGLQCKTLQMRALKANANLGVCKAIDAGRRFAPFCPGAALSSPARKRRW